ncbi:g6398 [Coccomyxa elongata]
MANSELLLQRMGASLVFIQPAKNGKPLGPSLMVELQSGTVGMAEHSMPLHEVGGQGTPDKILGIIGLAKLVSCSVLAVITHAEKVADLRGHAVFKVTGTRLIESGTSSSKDDPKYIDLLRTAMNPAEAGRGLYFSYGADITLTQQRWAEAGEKASKLLGKRAEPRFFWNRHLLASFTEPTKMPIAEGGPEVEVPAMPELAQFVLPLMQGSVHQISDLRFQTSTADYTGTLTLIARRSAQRPGVRHWRRGAEPTGKVANFVETEQLVELTAQGAPRPVVVSSFVQVRGSIPLLWSQIPNIKYKPTTRVSPPSAYEPAFDNHINDLLSSYQNVLAVNLANQHGSEGILGKAFKEEAERFAKVKPGFDVISFDFHKECGATRYDRLEKLWAMIEPFVERFGTYQANGEQRKQSGVLRINCIDCLDRTNVVQGWLARKQLDHLLAQLSLLPQGSSIKEAFPEVERRFKWVWADHGDDISRQYAGTGALKSGFTRTGQRTLGGLLDDGVKSAMRYFLNNFRDGRKQDALDLLTGTYTISKDKPSPFKASFTGLPLIAVALLLMLMAAVSGFHTVAGTGNGGIGYIVQTVLLPIVLAVTLLQLVVKNGKKWVDKPQLCPDMSQPW